MLLVVKKSNLFSRAYGRAETKGIPCELVSQSLELIINYRWQIDLCKAIVSADKIKLSLIKYDEHACTESRGSRNECLSKTLSI